MRTGAAKQTRRDVSIPSSMLGRDLKEVRELP